jgi:hypothetical protein
MTELFYCPVCGKLKLAFTWCTGTYQCFECKHIKGNIDMGNLDIIENKDATPSNLDFDLIPPGVYIAEVTTSDVAETKSGTGTMLKITHQILDGPHTGRMIFTNFNIKNQNEKAVEISIGLLGSLSRACNLLAIPSDSMELHGIMHQIKVAIRPAKGEYPASNSITSYLPLDKGAPKRKEVKPTVADAEPLFVDPSVPDWMR